MRDSQDITTGATGATRRNFLRRAVGKPVHHTASVLVQAWPERIAEIAAAVTSQAGIESHGDEVGTKAGKLILTIEAASDMALMQAMDRIQATPGVINTALVYHHMDEDLGDE